MMEDYGRGQVEYALWNAFAPPHVKTREVNKTFKARIKRLLELDHIVLEENKHLAVGQNYAFTAKPDERGVTVKYSGLDTICLGIALESIDMGFTQKQVARLMQLARRVLKPYFERDLAYGHTLPNLDHGSPPLEKSWLAQQSKADSLGADAIRDDRAFLLISAVELTGIDFEKDGVTEPDISAPILFRGSGKLAKHLSQLQLGEQRSFTIIEVAFLSKRIITMLEAAPKIARGRPPGS